jgi:hypothetical protein
MKKLLLASFITLLAFGTACGQASEPEPAPSDGIQVHGHWTVTVTNPDGTIDAVHEFENALAEYGGSTLLVALLTGTTAINTGYGQEPYMNGWAIHLTKNDTSTWDFNCSETGTPFMGDVNVIRELRPSGGSSLRLIATCTVTGIGASNNITLVGVDTSALFTDHITFAYGSTNVANTRNLTETDIVPIPLQDSQQISVNVDISFS